MVENKMGRREAVIINGEAQRHVRLTPPDAVTPFLWRPTDHPE